MDYKVAVHQPNFLPWIGYFYKLYLSDIFIFQKHVEHSKRSYTRRTKIAKENSEESNQWLTVPLLKHRDDSLIADLVVENTTNWRESHLKKIENAYHKEPFFSTFFQTLSNWYYETKEMKFLYEINEFLIQKISDYLDIKTEFREDDSNYLDFSKTDRLVSMVTDNSGKIYITGLGGKKYLEENGFVEKNISLAYYNVAEITETKQKFHPELSILDPIFKIGKEETLKLMKSTSQNFLNGQED